MEFTAAFFALTVPAVFFAGVSKGGFGSGAAFAATPFLALALPADVAVGLMLPLLMVMDVTGIRPYWRRWSWRDARALMGWSVPGIAAGFLLFHWADPDLVKGAIGTIAILFVVFMVARDRGWVAAAPRPFSPVSAGIAGFATGFTSFVSHAGGPPAAMHLLARDLDKTAYQATTMLVFWWVNLVKLPPFLTLGLVTRETLLAGLVLAPVAILGTLAGVWAHRRIPDRPFFLLIYGFLAVTGGKLLWDAVG